jgi:two-component system sensor histidine kinase DesK
VVLPETGTVEVVASLVAIFTFLGLFWTIWRRRGNPLLWQVLAIYAIGMSLSTFATGWSVYTIYSMSFASRMAPRQGWRSGR